VVGSAGVSSSGSGFCSRLICFTTINTTKATIKKLMIELINKPTLMVGAPAACACASES
jgi:hypothetical protein